MLNKKVFYYVGMGVGLLAIILGFVCMGMDASYYGKYTQEASFGADFYTYTYGGIVDVSKNINNLGHMIASAMSSLMKICGMFMIVLGLTDVAYFGSKAFDGTKKAEAETVEQKAEESVVSETATEEIAVEETVEETAEVSEEQ